MSLGRIADVCRFFYFRIVFAPALQTPISLSGLCYLVAHPSAAGLAVAVCALVGAHSLLNGMLFRSGFLQKARVWQFLDEFQGARFERLPATDFGHLFDPDFLIPSVFRPRWLVDHVLRKRCRVYFVARVEGAPIFTSPRAFVSPLAQDVYVFLRDRRPDAESSPAHFRLAHELGHGAAILSSTLKRNLVGVKCVLASILWILLISPFSPALLLWTAAELLFCLRLATWEFADYRRQESFFAEVAADYMAVRHLSPESAARLMGRAAPLFDRDPGLTDAQHRLREEAYRKTLSDVARGEPFDIPRLYMDHYFRPPPALVAFTWLHWSYVAFFSWSGHASVLAAAAVAILPMIYFFSQVRRDGIARHIIDIRLSGGPPAAAAS